MNNFNRGGGLQDFTFAQPVSKVEVRPLLRLVYLWMMFGLLTTAAVAWWVGSSQERIISIAQYWTVLFFVELGIGLALSWGLPRMSPTVAGALFFVYSAINGLFFGVIIAAMVYNGQTGAVASAFLTAAGLFGSMTVLGFVTKVDLSKFRTFFMMAVLGLFIAIIINMFLGSSAMDFVISIAGVLIFTALTAFRTQQIKELANLPQYRQYGSETTKLAIFGAFILYLAFINLFYFLLRLYSGRR
ncbi:MAG: Bax inhibitor-1/YccA family protein [Anaerolineae bacterium]|nr:Bax inhibitor-1/YccA family protein [Anaerolineae bacterium]MDQ7033710.1 Bax inhibitor-1/YccA family protein [Anaerolineae bacterium]